MRRIAIGDIHGCNRTFRTLLERLAPARGDEIVLLGDLIDRGPDSKGVVDTVMELRQSGVSVVALLGNHEQAFLASLRDPDVLPRWLHPYGGEATAISFGVGYPWDLDETYLNFFREMPLYYEVDGYLFVHAGLDFGVADPLSARESMTLIRHWEDDVNYDWLGERRILYGHTPRPKHLIEGMHRQFPSRRVLCLDAGCVYGAFEEGLGYLTACDLTADTLYFEFKAD